MKFLPKSVNSKSTITLVMKKNSYKNNKNNKIQRNITLFLLCVYVTKSLDKYPIISKVFENINRGVY